MILNDWLSQKPFTLTLSSGFFSFFAHAGMLAALEEQNLLPQKLTGSSAGALVAACWAAGLNTTELKNILFELKRTDFWDPGFGWGLLKGDKFRQILTDILPVETFEECRAELSLSAYDIKTKSTVIINSGELVPAIYGSCAIPFLFQPINYHGHRLLDGGIKDRAALADIGQDERVFYHHIVSVSPWRSKQSKALEVPQRENLVSLQLFDLPRCGPTKLHLGPEAFVAAYNATKRALKRDIGAEQKVALAV